MKVLVIGNGGREHALAWKLAQSPLVKTVYVAPGNAGTYREPKVENVPIDPLHFEELVEFVKVQQINFTVVGPEAPLVAGIVDYFTQRNLPCLGPTKDAAQLEGSKVFSKAFMERHNIPTARARVFNSLEAAQQYLAECAYPIVIKADGLAAGKGVVIAKDKTEAEGTVVDMLSHKRFGLAGDQIIIEDFLEGEEVSFIVLCDGEHYVPLATSQDHKARDDGDKGPNTGGMGAYSPAPLVSPHLHDEILATVIEPTLKGLSQEGYPFKGFLYAGLMISPKEEIKVLEYNCRFGDPETQPILMRLASDFAQMCLDALNGTLNTYVAEWDPNYALGVVLAAAGYPDEVKKGDVCPTLNDIAPSKVYKIFHAGTKIEEGRILTNGGRVLCVTALGETLQDAQTKAYRIVKKVAWDGVFYRSDIGYKALGKN
ncbi:MAG: phosphoribosylamine--glycine ligase [Gammaproteobacteria bacterium 39-13]|nr:phosphoribosylamine--glycine ligase [Gammaproteobacteria bacterium]OJV85630.1 MAG: phosphoribosylamine--glycine ligase [Gammaproteobacteria bacterium 39-13]